MRPDKGWLAAPAVFAAFAAVISYRDGLFVARLAGNADGIGYLYPLLPDGLILISLLALYEASRAKVPRSRWALFGLVLGIALTLAQNVYAGIEHSLLDAIEDGMVPVVFFVAVHIVLWHVRRGRPAAAPAQLPPPEFTDKTSAAEVAYRRSVSGGNPLKPYTLATRFEIPRPVAAEIVERVSANGNGAHG